MPRGRLDSIADVTRQAEALPLRYDMVTLLSYVRDNRIIGTQSTGNLPLKAVHEVTARFVHPPVLKETIGGHTYEIRSADDIWPMFFLHILLDVGGLTKAGRARLWRLTRKGEKFLATDAISQVLFLLSTWWYRVNWLVAYSYTGMGNSLPPRFAERTLASLRSLPVKKRIAFAGFADELISRTGLTWSVPDIARMALHGAIRRMVIGILADFGAVTLNYRKKPLGRGTIRELVAFRITMFGDFLLKALTQSSEPVDLRGFGNASGSAA